MKKSINSLVPNEDAELALLREIRICGGEGDTGYIIDRQWSVSQFSHRQS